MDPEGKLNEFHLILAAKGGVGKSLVASLIGQYKRDYKQAPAVCVDIDPFCPTFRQFKSLNVGFVDVTEGGKAIIPSKFDSFINAAAESDDDFVVDSATSVFISLMNYLSQDSIIEAMAENMNKKVFIHTVLVGGQALKSTAAGIGMLLDGLPKHPNVKFVIWLNEFFGPVEIDGIPLKNLQIIKDAGDRIAGFVKIRGSGRDALSVELRRYNDRHMTLADAMKGQPLLCTKQRLDAFAKDIFSQIEAVLAAALL